METIEITSPEQFRQTIQIDDYAIGALLVLYSYQTIDEQIQRGTTHQNDQGFNGADGGFCSSLAEQYKLRGRLTDKQIFSLKRLLPKYHSQVRSIAPFPNQNKVIENIEGIKQQEKLVVMTGGNLIITFPYDGETVSRVKEISGRKWNAAKKQWEAPLSYDAVDELLKMGFKVTDYIQSWFDKQAKAEKEPISDIPGLRATLYPYQRDGISFIDDRNGRALIGDEMGLGKTLQALGWLQLRRTTALPAIVVCPASLKLNWAREALKFTDLEPVIINGRDKKSFVTFPGGNRKDIYVINYDVLYGKEKCQACGGSGKVHGEKCKPCKGKGDIPCLHPEIEKLGIKTAIFDECHYCKTNGTGRTIAAQALSQIASHVITLSGTPIVNRPVEFFNAIQMTDPKVLPSWWQYTRRYCNRKHTGFGWDVSGASNTEELHKKLTRTIMLRRLKKDVLTQLPPKVRTVVPIDIDLKKYARIMDAAVLELESAKNKAQHLVIIERAKQAVVSLKIKLALEWIEDYLDNGEKLVVFAEHKVVIDEVFEHFGKRAVRIYGGTSQTERQSAVDRFQNDPTCELFIGSKSAKEGLTLTAAHATCFLELWWVHGDHLQAEDRVHRIGQEADSVTAYYLLAANTIEEDIAALLDSKQKVVESILDGKIVEEESMLTALMEKILEKKNGKSKAS